MLLKNGTCIKQLLINVVCITECPIAIRIKISWIIIDNVSLTKYLVNVWYSSTCTEYLINLSTNEQDYSCRSDSPGTDYFIFRESDIYLLKL